MRVEYVCHACLAINTGDVRIVTDPWFLGSAYCDQWFVFPKPVRTEVLQKVDVLAISHGHEDHLHEASLRHLPRRAKVLYPFYWHGGVRDFIRSMGYQDVRELYNFKTYRVTSKTSVTFVSNYLDSVVVIESHNRVLVDVNDALHSAHPNVIDIFLTAIRHRWPKVDTVFCGFGGASYFPNTVHVPGKSDIEIGKLREHLFVHNFCRIVNGLAPRVAVPFAADFVLLDPEKMWINTTRFSREQIAAYYDENFGGNGATHIHAMYPGDVLVDDTLQPCSPYRKQLRNGDLTHLIAEQYALEIKAKKHTVPINVDSADALSEEIVRNVRDRIPLVQHDMLSTLRFCVRVTDVQRDNYYNIHFRRGKPILERAATPMADCPVIVDTSSRILRYSFASDWGGDAMVIGYGCDIYYTHEDDIEHQLDRVIMKLLTRRPSMKHYMLRNEPLRAVKYFASNRTMQKRVMQYLRNNRMEQAIYDPNLWLRRTKCEICQVCDMPLLDDALSSRLTPPLAANNAAEVRRLKAIKQGD